MCKRLDGKTAMVTGSGRGVGRAIAKELAALGANIVLHYHTHALPALALAREIEEYESKALVLQADVTNYEQVGAIIRQVIKTFGQIDILVNNVGITRDIKLRNMSRDQWEEVIHVNLNGLFNCTKQVLPYMFKN